MYVPVMNDLPNPPIPIISSVEMIPPTIQPNMAIFDASQQMSRPMTWQQPAHLTIRLEILRKVGIVLGKNRTLVERLGGSTNLSQQISTVWQLARRLEAYLFLGAHSFEEYTNVKSLEKRMQCLIVSMINRQVRKSQLASSRVVTSRVNTSIHPNPTPEFSSISSENLSSTQNPHLSTLLKNTLKACSNSDQNMLPAIAQSCMASNIAKKRRRSSLSFFFGNQEDIIKHIYSFINGVEAIRHRSINHMANQLLPLCVNNFHVSCNQMSRVLDFTSATSSISKCPLYQYPNVEKLEILSLSEGGSFQDTSTIQSTSDPCPQRFVISHSDHEDLIHSLSSRLLEGLFPKLKALYILGMFTNEEEGNGEVFVLMDSLIRGACPQLVELSLGGNSIGDHGALKVAELLGSKKFPNLTLLDLRRNFIGERGLRALARVLADGFVLKLETLRLGGNILTDSCIPYLMTAMETGHCSKLKWLDVESNCLTKYSMLWIGKTIGKMVCPSLHTISFNHNHIANATAKKILQTAIAYQKERNHLEIEEYDEDDSSSEDDAHYEEVKQG